MKKTAILVFLFLITSIALATTTKDYIKFEYEGQNIYTEKALINSNFILGSDKYFYGSKEGNIVMKVYIADKLQLTDKAYKIGVETEGKPIKILKIKTPNREIEFNNPKEITNWIYNGTINVKNFLNETEIFIEFDPELIGLREKIDVILYDLQKNEIVRYDPFLSGFNNRTEIIMNTDGISLGGNITNDHTIYPPLDPSHPFWVSDTCADGTGFDFTQSDEVTILDFNIINFDVGTTDANIAVKFTPTFTSGSDAALWFYWNGTCSDNSDGSGAYPATYLTNLHWEELAGNPKDSTSNNETVTLTNSPTQGVSGILGKGIDFLKASSQYAQGDDIIDGARTEYSFTGWIRSRVTINSNVDTAIYRKVDGADYTTVSIGTGLAGESMGNTKVGGVSSFIQGAGNFLAGQWYQLAYSTDQTANAHALYRDSALDASGSADIGSMNQSNPLFIASFEGSSQFFDGVFDEFVFYNYALSADEAKLLFNVYDPAFYTFGVEEVLSPDFNLTFNVFQQTGINTHLDNLTIDFNVDIYDASSLTSPFTINDVNSGDYLITISKNEWDVNTFVLTVDANSTTTIFIDKFVYPAMVQFERDANFTSNSINYQTIETFQFETTFGASTALDIGCTFWTATDNVATRDVDFRLQMSEDAAIWIDQAETTRSFGALTVAGSIFIQTLDFNVLDGNHFFRIQQKRDSGALFNITTDDLVCLSTIHRDQNNFIIPDFDERVTGATTTNNDFEKINTFNIISGVFNGFLYGYGDISYSYGATGGTGAIKFGLQGIADSNGSAYLRTTGANSIGVGGFSEMFSKVLDASTSYAIETFARTTAGTLTSAFTFLSKQLNQQVGEFDIIDLNTMSTSATDFEILAEIDLNLLDTSSDYKVFASMPISCNAADCLFESKLQIHNGTYDINSLVMKRETNSAETTGIAILQYIFEDVNATSVTLKLWGKTDTGTITLNGGSMSIIKVNSKVVTLPNPPQDPLIITPINGSDVNVIVDYNCFTIDPNGDALQYDVNIILKDTNDLVLNLENTGDGSGSFDSTALGNGDYTFQCTATEVTPDAFTSRFDNSDYIFTINNIIEPISIVGTGNCEIDLETNFYLDQYLQITYSGFDSNGIIINAVSFDLYKGKDLLISNQTLDLVGNLLTFVSDKKTNDDPYNLILTADECINTRIIQRN